MRLPNLRTDALVLAILLILWGVWLRANWSPVSPSRATANGIGTSESTVAQVTQTLADQRIDFSLYRNQFTAVLTEIRAGGQTGRFKPLVPSFVYVLEGTLTFDVEAHGIHTFATGQGFAPGINVWQKASNRTDHPVKILTIYAGNDEQRLNMLPPDDVDGRSNSFDFVVGPFESGPGR